jgi:hypothetical protein
MGASVSKTNQTSITEIVNNIVNTTVVKSVTEFSTTATASQKMKIGCTDSQFGYVVSGNSLQMSLYKEMYTAWLKSGGIGKPPPLPEQNKLCDFSDIDQSVIINIKTDNASKSQLTNDIVNDIKTQAEQRDSLEKMKDLVGFSDTQKDTILKIANNVKNETFVETLTKTINSIVVNQEMDISGGNVARVKQSAVVGLISDAITENITRNTQENETKTEGKQDSSLKEQSGQEKLVQSVADTANTLINGITDTANTLINGITDIAKSAMGMWLIFILVIVGSIILFPGIFCKIPPLKIPMMILGLCSNDKNKKN